MIECCLESQSVGAERLPRIDIIIAPEFTYFDIIAMGKRHIDPARREEYDIELWKAIV